MIPHFDIICFSSVHWGPIWGRTRHLMHNIAGLRNCRVLHVNPDLDFIALLQGPRHFIRKYGMKTIVKALFGKTTADVDNIVVFTPVRLIPFSGRYSFLRKIDVGIYANRMVKIIRKHLGERYILWINKIYRFDRKHDALRLKPLATVFDWDDDWLSFSKYDHPGSGQLRDPEAENAIYRDILNRVDAAVVVSEPLLRRSIRMHRRVYKVKNATALCDETWQGAGIEEGRRPEKADGYKKVGYVGHICNRINLEMIDHAARMDERLQFYLYGPIMKSFRVPEEISRNRRIHFAGSIASHELWSFLSDMDVLVIPHYQDDTTDAQDPVKLYDYLSTGKPIVTTRIAGVEVFGELVTIVDSPQQFYHALKKSIEADDPGRVTLRIRAAAENSWKNRAGQVIGIIDETITRVARAAPIS